MKRSHVEKALEAALNTRRPMYIEGPPGIGKSQVTRQTAGRLGYQVRDVRTTLLDPVDLRGVPSVQDGKTVWHPPEFLPDTGRWVIFLDELPNAPNAVQSALLQLVLDRELGKYRMPEEAVVIAAGNRVTDRAGAGRLITSLLDRFIRVEMEADYQDWVDWALGAGIATEIVAFIRWRPNLLSAFDPQQPVSPSPRSWHFVSEILPHLDPEVELDVLKGIVGGATEEFLGFLRIARQLPDPDVVLMDPGKAQVPEDPATLYALCGALAARAGEQNAERVLQYAGRLPDEFNVLLVTDAMRHAEEHIVHTRAFQSWASKHASVLSGA